MWAAAQPERQRDEQQRDEPLDCQQQPKKKARCQSDPRQLDEQLKEQPTNEQLPLTVEALPQLDGLALPKDAIKDPNWKGWGPFGGKEYSPSEHQKSPGYFTLHFNEQAKDPLFT